MGKETVPRRLSIFISYSRQDKQIVDQLASILERGGQRPWIDRDLMPGQRWRNELKQSITDCDAFLIALSPDALDSDWCLWEFEEAVRQEKPIFPVLVRKVGELPEEMKSLHEFQFLDISNGIQADSAAALIGGLFIARPVKDSTTDTDKPATEPKMEAVAEPIQLPFGLGGEPPLDSTEPLTRLPMPMENPLPRGVEATITIAQSPTEEPRTIKIVKTIFEIGRSKERDLPIKEKRISKLHVTIYWANGAFFLIDNSLNGTWLNGERVTSNRSYRLDPHFTHGIDMAGNYTVLHFHYKLPET
jgi:hypothetical protein